jgi:hypothetical protein
MLMLTTLKDVASIAGPVLSPAIGAATAIALHRWKFKEVADCYIDWSFRGRDGSERASLVVHNRGERSVAIKSLEYWSGCPRRSRAENTALDYEDLDEIGFPYIVEPNATRWIPVDDRMAARLLKEASRFSLWLTRLGRPRLLLRAVTMAGTVLNTSGETLLPWDEQPPWLRRRG